MDLALSWHRVGDFSYRLWLAALYHTIADFFCVSYVLVLIILRSSSPNVWKWKGVAMIKQTSKRPFWITLTTLLVVPAYVMSVQGLTLAAAGVVDENRIETIAAQLSGKTAGFGLPIDNRRIWKKLLEQAIPARPL